jgi:hypothetical protein
MAMPPVDETSDELVIYPPPPDSARIQFLTSISNSTDITGKRNSFMRYILGEQESLPIFKPYGITSSKGKIYICDTQFGGIEIIDLEKKEFSYFKPSGRGQILKPVNCALDEKGYLYVADTERNQIVIFDDQLKYFSSFGDPSQFKPTDVAYHDGKIWVCNLKEKQIHIYSETTQALLLTFPKASQEDPGYLFSPTNLSVTDQNVYVSDFGDFKIKVYSQDGKFETSIGSYGQSPGQFVRPKGIAVDRDHNLYVADAGFENVQIFDRQGHLLLFFGGSYKGSGGMWLPAKVALDYENLSYFQKYVDRAFKLKYLIFVTNQFGPEKINVYGLIEYR